MQPAVPGAVAEHEVGVRGEDGREVAAPAEGSAAPLQDCVAVVLEVLEGGGAIRGAEGESHTRNMASVPATAVGEGRAPGQSHWRPLEPGGAVSGPRGSPLGLERPPKAHRPALVSGKRRMKEILGVFLPWPLRWSRLQTRGFCRGQNTRVRA